MLFIEHTYLRLTFYFLHTFVYLQNDNILFLFKKLIFRCIRFVLNLLIKNMVEYVFFRKIIRKNKF